MNWQHLIYFKTVAEMKNYAKAAEFLFITPSALSKAIHNLEIELGFPLFHRVGRLSVLTCYGQTFYECVFQVSNSIDDCVQHIHAEMGLVNGRIRIGGIYTMCSEYIPKIIREIKKTYPDIKVELNYYTTDIILQNLLNGSIDLGFCGNFDLEDKTYGSLDRFYIKSEEIVVIVSSENELAKCPFLNFQVLQDENFIVHKNSNTGTNYIFRKLCAQYQIAPNIAFEAPDDQSILGLVKNNLGIAVMADSPSLRCDGINFIHIQGECPPVRDQYMVWNKATALSPITKAFQQKVMLF